MIKIRFQPLQILFSLLLITVVGILAHSVWAENRGENHKDAVPPNSRLGVDSLVYDFGVVTQGEIVEHSFAIHNSGGSALQINAVQPSCGCSAAVSEASTLAPGQKSAIRISFNTAGFHGYKVKTFRVFSNDPQQSTVVLTVQGTVRREVDIDPPRLYFGTLSKEDLSGPKATLQAKISTDGHSSAKVLDVASRSQDLKVNFAHSGDSSFSVTLRPDLSVGVLRSRVAVKTSSPKTPVINVPVFVRVEGDLHLAPQDVSIGLVEGPLTAPLTRTVRLLNHGKKPIHIVSVSSDKSEVKADYQMLEDGRSYEINVHIAQNTIGALKAQIEVRTDHPDSDQKNISFPVFGIISRKGE